MKAFFKRMMEFLAKMIGSPAVKPEADPTVSLDAIPASEISWDEPAGDVGSWETGAVLINPRMTLDGMQVDSVDGTAAWPLAGGKNPKLTIGNWWIIAFIDGKWHAATADHYGRGKTLVVGKYWEAGKDGLHGALAGWTGVRGEKVYIMISTPARSGVPSLKRRSPIYEGKVV